MKLLEALAKSSISDLLTGLIGYESLHGKMCELVLIRNVLVRGVDVGCFSEGVARARSMILHHKSDARKQGIIIKIILNAVWTQARKAHMPDNHEGTLCRCDTDNETLTHLWWECPRWDDTRARHDCFPLPYTTW